MAERVHFCIFFLENTKLLLLNKYNEIIHTLVRFCFLFFVTQAHTRTYTHMQKSRGSTVTLGSFKTYRVATPAPCHFSNWRHGFQFSSFSPDCTFQLRLWAVSYPCLVLWDLVPHMGGWVLRRHGCGCDHNSKYDLRRGEMGDGSKVTGALLLSLRMWFFSISSKSHFEFILLCSHWPVVYMSTHLFTLWHLLCLTFLSQSGKYLHFWNTF